MFAAILLHGGTTTRAAYKGIAPSSFPPMRCSARRHVVLAVTGEPALQKQADLS